MPFLLLYNFLHAILSLFYKVSACLWELFLAFYMPASLNLADFGMPFLIFKAIRMPSTAAILSVTQC
jgi:hypothetical protein